MKMEKNINNRRGTYDIRNKIMLVDPLFADKVKILQANLNKQWEEMTGRKIKSKRPPVTGVMVTGMIAKKMKRIKLKKELVLNI